VRSDRGTGVAIQRFRKEIQMSWVYDGLEVSRWELRATPGTLRTTCRRSRMPSNDAASTLWPWVDCTLARAVRTRQRGHSGIAITMFRVTITLKQ